jgi:hypothetical protein
MIRLPLHLLSLLLVLFLPFLLHAQVQYGVVSEQVIAARLQGYANDNAEREKILSKMFVQSGCAGDKLTEQSVQKKLPPNLICTVPGRSDREILVVAHSDHADVGDGVVDNWSGAALLPSLMYSIAGVPRQHQFVYIAFTGEEGGLLGSDFYARKLSNAERSKIDAVVNLDSLGLGPTDVWVTHSDKELVSDLTSVATALKLPLHEVDVDGVGSSDSESFAQYKIPRITVHSVTPDTYAILHSKKDTVSVIKEPDYYASYRLLTAYLAVLDTNQDRTAPKIKH